MNRLVVLVSTCLDGLKIKFIPFALIFFKPQQWWNAIFRIWLIKYRILILPCSHSKNIEIFTGEALDDEDYEEEEEEEGEEEEECEEEEEPKNDPNQCKHQ